MLETIEKRLKKWKFIQFKKLNEEEFREGFIKDVGKKTGKDKDTCWVLREGKKEAKAIDFRKEVETWKYKVLFTATENQLPKDILEDKHMEAKGVFFI